ncbi:rolling circle replication-associated protein, partial [Tenacibaculum maritimum]
LRKIRSAVENMVATILLNYDYSKKPHENDKYLAFVTLTLPYAQMHTDAVLRRSLIKFIDNLRKTYGVEHYVWKAEAQKNGNIHFHLIIDKYINMDVIKRLWNKQLSKLGYIQKYAEKRRKEGFIYKPFYMCKGVKVKSRKSYEEQKKYFEYEKSIGFSSPYSTEIKSLKDVSDTSAYIMKYMDKLELDKR